MSPAERPSVCFIHVQKCGGTSIKEAIRSAFRPRRHDEVVVDLDAAASTRQAERMGMTNFEFRDQLLAYELDSRYTRVVMGHFRYTEALHAPFLDRVNFITVLRDPVDRLLSAYFYDRYKDDDYGKVHDPLEQFLLKDGEPSLRGRVHAEKYMATFRGDGTPDSRRADQVDIDATIRNLQRFALVGFLEHLDPFVAQLEEWADAPLDIPTLNRSPASSSQREELTDELREVVEEICRPAQIVYDRLRDHVFG